MLFQGLRIQGESVGLMKYYSNIFGMYLFELLYNIQSLTE